MANLVAIIGPPGSGKSSSVETLDPKETFIFNVAGKELPFKGSSKKYNTENKNLLCINSAKDITAHMQNISDKAAHIHNIVIEDSNYIMAFNLLDKATEIGFTKFSVMAKEMVAMLKSVRNLREDLTVFYITHSDEVKDEESIIGYKIKTAGKAIDTQVQLEGLFTVCLYTYVEEKNGQANYHFITNRFHKFPAKSPKGMFENTLIPNDLQLVATTINEYYK